MGGEAISAPGNVAVGNEATRTPYASAGHGFIAAFTIQFTPLLPAGHYWPDPRPTRTEQKEGSHWLAPLPCCCPRGPPANQLSAHTLCTRCCSQSPSRSQLSLTDSAHSPPALSPQPASSCPACSGAVPAEPSYALNTLTVINNPISYRARKHFHSPCYSEVSIFTENPTACNWA